MIQNKLEWLETLKPFNSPNDIPNNFPVFEEDEYAKLVVPKLISLGAIPKTLLEDGKTYIGSSRNATEAIWQDGQFIYKRFKWGFNYLDSILHFEDEPYADMFIPIKIKE